MHDTYQRLMQAASDLHRLSKQTDVGKLIDETDQTMTNWKTRGVPKAKHVAIAEVIGVNPAWLASGRGPMQGSLPPALPTLTPQIDPIVEALETIARVRPAKAALFRAQILAELEEIVSAEEAQKKTSRVA